VLTLRRRREELEAAGYLDLAALRRGREPLAEAASRTMATPTAHSCAVLRCRGRRAGRALIRRRGRRPGGK